MTQIPLYRKKLSLPETNSVALALLMARVLLADDANDTLAADNLAGIANLLNAGSDLHDFLEVTRRLGRGLLSKCGTGPVSHLEPPGN